MSLGVLAMFLLTILFFWAYSEHVVEGGYRSWSEYWKDTFLIFIILGSSIGTSFALVTVVSWLFGFSSGL